jgi:hypothetical protein
LKRTLIPALALAAGVSAQAQYSAWLPEERQFIATPGFTYSTFDEFWMGDKKVKNPGVPAPGPKPPPEKRLSRPKGVTPPPPSAAPLVKDGESLDQYTGYISLEYGILRDLAADVTVGYTRTETDAFVLGGDSDDGLADTLIGLRYRVVNERDHDAWVPSVALRVGGIIPGTYDENFPFSAGDGAAGVEGSLLLAKEICPGFGVFGDIGYRFREDDVPDDVFGSAGIYAGYRGFNGTVAYRHVQGTSGPDIGDPGFGTRFGFPEVKEISQNIEFGLGYTDGERHYQVFYARTLDGRNTGERNIFGVSVSFVFGGE